MHGQVPIQIMAVAILCCCSCGAIALTDTNQQPSSRPSTQPASQPASRPAGKDVRSAHGTFGTFPEAKGAALFIHMVTSFDHDDNPACVAFNMALAARKLGRPVVMCFDAGAVSDLKVWKGAPTALRYELPKKLKAMLERRYGVAADQLPQTYQQYLYALKLVGVRIAANGFMAQLVSLTDDPEKPGQLERIVDMWSLEVIVSEREKAGAYLRF